MIIEAVLNRLRGTGKIISFINGNIIYALYIGIVFALLSYNHPTSLNSIFIGFVAMTLYILGEASGWGKWVGSLCHPENVTESVKQETKNGVFFAIHTIANFFIPQKLNYFWYCRVALTLRGIYWWLPLYLFLGFVGLINYYEALVIGLLLGVGFPVASELGRLWGFTFKFKIFHLSRGWENQEFIYGALQGIALWYVVWQNVF